MSAEPSHPLLSEPQRRVAAFAITLFAALGSLALLISAIVVLGRLLAFFSGVLWPLAVAGILALILRPLAKQIERRLKLRRLSSVVMLYGVVVVLASGVLLLILPRLITQIIDFFGYLPTLWQSVSRYVSAHYPDWVALIEKYMANPRVSKMVEGIVRSTFLYNSHGELVEQWHKVKPAGHAQMLLDDFVQWTQGKREFPRDRARRDDVDRGPVHTVQRRRAVFGDRDRAATVWKQYGWEQQWRTIDEERTVIRSSHLVVHHCSAGTWIQVDLHVGRAGDYWFHTVCNCNVLRTEPAVWQRVTNDVVARG